MAKKFKVNECVRIVATGEVGTVKGREILPIEGSKRVNIEYVVKVGNGFSSWKSYTKKELEPIRNEKEELRTYTKVYDVVDGYKITMYAKVDNFNYPKFEDFNYVGRGKERELRIGYSIYSPTDVYDEKLGVKIARKRSRTSPFCKMLSDFSGEFNAATVKAIMDVKADYIKNNFDKFIKKSTEA